METISRNGRPGNPLPFDAVPRELATCPKLDRATRAKDYFVAGRLLFHARQDDRTVVADGRIARELGLSVSTIQRAIRRLERAQWIRREPAPKSRENATGRVIVLCWRVSETNRSPATDTTRSPVTDSADTTRSPATDTTRSPVTDNIERGIERRGIENASPTPYFSQSPQTRYSSNPRLTPAQARKQERRDYYKAELAAQKEDDR